MASNAYFTILGREDLREIGHYIALDNPARAASFIHEIHAKCLIYADNPDMGRDRSDLAAKVRSFPHGNTMIFYRRFRRGIQIVRVIHAQRDITPDALADATRG